MIKITHVFPTLYNSKFRLRKITLMETYAKNYTINIRRGKKSKTFTLYFKQNKTNNKNL